MPTDVTQLLRDWKEGSQSALDQITPLVYHELRRLASSHLRRERPGHTLQPTALIHEAYLRMCAQDLPDWNGRAHFFGVASQIMRQILVDHARKHSAQKRGSGQTKLQLNEALAYAPALGDQLVLLDDCLNELAKADARKAKVIEMRFFGGLSVEETAEALGISVATMGREFRFAVAWLHREMSANPVASSAAAP